MSGAAPAVSVVLPTRNRADLLGGAIDSVLEQTDGDLELIVVDDGSTDGTADLLARVGDPRLRTLRLEGGRGAPAARNAGIAIARAPLLGFQDSDDRWVPDKLARQRGAFAAAAGDVGVVYGMTEAPADGEAPPRRVPGPCDERRSGDLQGVLPRYNIVGLPAALVRSTAVHEVGGFDERLGRFQDWDLFLSLTPRWRFLCIDTVVLQVGAGDDRITVRPDSYFTALELLLAKHEALFRRLPEAHVAYRMQLVAELARQHRWAEALGHLRIVLRQPVAAGQWGAGAVVGRPRAIDRERCR